MEATVTETGEQQVRRLLTTPEKFIDWLIAEARKGSTSTVSFLSTEEHCPLSMFLSKQEPIHHAKVSHMTGSAVVVLLAVIWRRGEERTLVHFYDADFAAEFAEWYEARFGSRDEWMSPAKLLRMIRISSRRDKWMTEEQRERTREVLYEAEA